MQARRLVPWQWIHDEPAGVGGGGLVVNFIFRHPWARGEIPVVRLPPDRQWQVGVVGETPLQAPLVMAICLHRPTDV